MTTYDTKLQRYVDLLRSTDYPIPISTFCQELEVSHPTAWRALKRLVAGGTVEKESAGRGTRYKLVETYEQAIRIPLGLDSMDIDEYVNSPLALRNPARYRKEFLEAYKPNVSRYLPHSTTDRLAQIGEMRTGQIGMSAELKRLIERLSIDVSFGSSKLEGIASTYLDTESLILRGEESLSIQDRSEFAMILNHKSAIQLVLENRESVTPVVPVALNLPTVRQIHTLLMSGIHPDEQEIGKPRLREVSIEGSAYRPLNNPVEITDILDELLEKGAAITDPFEQSFFALIHLAYLQPFADGNKRTSRMIANIPLLKADLCPISFLATPKNAYTSALLGVYELNRFEMMRDVYVSSYEQTAHRIHQDRDRQVAPTVLELRCRREIEMIVADIIRNARDGDYVDVVRRRIARVNDLDEHQKTELLHIVLEKARNVTISSRHQYDVSGDEFRIWDNHRAFYVNTETIPVPSRQANSKDNR